MIIDLYFPEYDKSNYFDMDRNRHIGFFINDLLLVKGDANFTIYFFKPSTKLNYEKQNTNHGKNNIKLSTHNLINYKLHCQIVIDDCEHTILFYIKKKCVNIISYGILYK